MSRTDGTPGEPAPARADRDRQPASVDLARGTLRGPLRRGMRFVLLPLLRRVVGLRMEGLEHVPAEGPVLVVANHLHNADPILMEVVFPRPLHYMAKRELFGVPIVGWVSRRVGAFPVDRGKADRGALRHAEAVLAQGIAVGMFPEGTRSRSRRLGTALPGAGMVALRSGVPILPAAITGTERLPFNGAKAAAGGPTAAPGSAHPGVRVRFGPPFRLAAASGAGRIGVQEATQQMMAAIAALLPPDYRGDHDATVVGMGPERAQRDDAET